MANLTDEDIIVFNEDCGDGEWLVWRSKIKVAGGDVNCGRHECRELALAEARIILNSPDLPNYAGRFYPGCVYNN